MDLEHKQPRVAVVGLGLAGIGTLKNLLEEGFDAVGYDQLDHIGGLWHWYEDPEITTALKSTRANNSKQRSTFTDFDYPEGVDDFPMAAEVAKYIRDYAEHFNLLPHCHLSTKVERVERSIDSGKWAIKVKDRDDATRAEVFDKVVITSGSEGRPTMPKFDGSQEFKGKLLHSQQFKDPSAFASKRVVVVGLSNTSGDIAVDVAQVAAKTYLSHRSGNRIIRRFDRGKPVDHQGTRRLANIIGLVAAMFPTRAPNLLGWFIEQSMHRSFPNLKPEWRILPAQPFANAPAMVNDHLISLLEEERVISLQGIKRFLPNGHSIEFMDGSIVDNIDTVVACTGYQYDFSMLAPDADPRDFPTPEWDAHPNNNGLFYPRLYQGIFSTRYPDSLAFLGAFQGHSFTGFGNVDLSSQAITQIWKGNYELPPQSKIDAWCDQAYQRSLALLDAHHILKPGTGDMKNLETWLNEAAGNNVNQMLGWSSWAAWKFWWNDKELYKILMDGVDTTFVFRLFDSDRGANGRKKWDGAKEAIMRANKVNAQKK